MRDRYASVENKRAIGISSFLGVKFIAAGGASPSPTVCGVGAGAIGTRFFVGVPPPQNDSFDLRMIGFLRHSEPTKSVKNLAATQRRLLVSFRDQPQRYVNNLGITFMPFSI